MRLTTLAGLALLPLLPLACGSGETGTGTSTTGMPEASDGRYHPDGNGMAMAEDDACDALIGEQKKWFLHLSCVSTTHVCPDFLRAQTGMECLQYDQGTVQGCMTYYEQQKTCEQLSKSIDECAVAPLPGSAPKGCPATP